MGAVVLNEFGGARTINTPRFLITKLNGPRGGCALAHRGSKFLYISFLTRGRNFGVGGLGFGTIVTSAIVGSRHYVMVGPRACVGLDKRTMGTTTSFCGVPPRGVVIVFSSVSLSMNELEVHHGNSSNNRGNVGDVVSYVNDRGFPEIGVNYNGGPRPSCSLTT